MAVLIDIIREKDLEIFASDLIKFASEWIQDGVEFPGTFYCPTSSVFNARLTKMETILIQKPGFEKLYSLIVLVTGEIGDNSFAHNLGKWPDTAGIFLAMISLSALLFLLIEDWVF